MGHTTIPVEKNTRWDLKKVKSLRDDDNYDETIIGLLEEAGYEEQVREIFGEYEG